MSVPRSTLTLVILVFAAVPLSFAADADPSRAERIHPVTYLDIQAARLLVEEQVPALFAKGVGIEVLPQGSGSERSPVGYLRVFAAPEVHAQIERVLDRYDVPPPDRTFLVDLLEATDNRSETPTLPGRVKAALDDAGELLPYGRFRLLDSAMVRSTGRGRVQVGNFGVQLDFRGHREPGGPIHVERFELVRTSPLPEGTRSDSLLGTTLLGTSFYIEPGKTVIVGTARGVSEALIVLVTAVE